MVIVPIYERDGVPIAEQILFCLSWKWRKRSSVKIKDMLVGHQQEIQAERDRKLEAARQQRKNRRQPSP